MSLAMKTYRLNSLINQIEYAFCCLKTVHFAAELWGKSYGLTEIWRHLEERELEKRRKQIKPLNEMASKELCTVLLLCIVLYSSTEELTDRPIIGMLAMKITDEVLLKAKPELKGKSYIGASYMKFVQSAGGRVVPIVDDPKKNLTLNFILDRVNGVMLPGGEINLIDSKYYKIAKRIYEKAIEKNKKGVHFPIFGICRGFQALPVLTAGGIHILKEFDSKNVSLPMKIPEDYESSKMFKDLSDDLRDVMEKKYITANYHKYGIYPSEMTGNKLLKEDYRVLGTSDDMKGRKFVAAYEGEKYPFFGLQWHPEKAAFEWHPEKDTRHSWDAVRLGQFFANFFVNEARKNRQSFGQYEGELQWVIEKHQPTFTGFVTDSKTPFDQIYVF